jgi:anti-sigma factor RsiW
MQSGICHATGDQLDEYTLGQMDEPELEEFEQHLLLCPKCQEALALNDAYWMSMREAARQLRRPAGAAARPWFDRLLETPKPLWALGLAVLGLLVAVALTGPPWRRAHPPPAVVLLEATRGVEAPLSASVPAAKPISLILDLTGVPPLASYSVEIVDAAGHPVFHAPAAPADDRLQATVPQGLPGGMYYVRVYAPAQELLREYALQVGE